jgi:hypothetical protein
MMTRNYQNQAWEHSCLEHMVLQAHDSKARKRIDDRSVRMVDVDLDVSGMQLVVRRTQNRGLLPFHPFLMSFRPLSGVVRR